MGLQRSLVICKPDAVARGLVGTILERLETKGLSVLGLKLMTVSQGLAKKHYAEHAGKYFLPLLMDYITSGPVAPIVVEGLNAVEAVRGLVGATKSHEAAPGTIRGDLAMSQRFNLVHASDSVASAKREIALWFKRGELVKPDPSTRRWIYGAPGGELI